MSVIKKMAIAMAVAALVSCGGGGDKEDKHVRGAGAGWYQEVDNNDATSANNMWHDTVILEDGSYYSLYEAQDPDDPYSWNAGLIQGSGKGDKNKFVSDNLREFSSVGETFSGNLEATFPDQDSIKGTVTLKGSSEKASFEGRKISKDEFDYAKKANLQEVVGDWFAYDPISNEGGKIIVKNNNTFSGYFGENERCTFDGSIAPHSSGKNIFEVKLKFGPAPCTAPGESGNGIAAMAHEEGGSYMVFMGNNKERTLGTGFYAERSTELRM